MRCREKRVHLALNFHSLGEKLSIHYINTTDHSIHRLPDSGLINRKGSAFSLIVHTLATLLSSFIHAAQPPHITLHPTSQNDVLPGGSIIHLVRATGTEPLTYKWQWKPAGTEGELYEWQDLSCDGTTFQEVEAGLKLTGVQACHAGDYRCVVSNSAGSEISQRASLTVGKHTVIPNKAFVTEL